MLLLVFPLGSRCGLEPCSSLLPMAARMGVRSIPGAAVMSLSAAPRAVVQDIALSLGSGWDTACKEVSLVFIPVEKKRKGFLEGIM